MADAILVNGESNDTADTVQPFYTSPASGSGTRITAWTATNNSGVNRSYQAYIYDSSGVLVDSIIPFKVVIRNRFDLGSSAINHIIPAGYSLRIESSAANSLTFRVTGKEL